MEAIHASGYKSAEAGMTERSQELGIKPLRLAPLEPAPLVSVLVANYNYAHLIGQTIQSVLRQTYVNFELIICDDGSTDCSVQFIRTFQELDERIRLLQLPENQGMAAATNAAFAASSGQIICLLDSDDYFAPVKLERVVRQFQHEPSTGLIVHPMTIIQGESGVPVQQIPFMTRFEYGWIADRVIERGGRWRDMPTSALSLRREVAELVFPIPEPDFRRAADGYIFTLAPLFTEVSAIEEPLSKYRIHGKNDHAALSLELSAIESDERFIRIQNAHVNSRIESLRRVPALLSLNRHLAYQQKVMLLGLMRGEPRRSLFNQYPKVLRMLWTDDLYSRKQKVFGVLVYGIAILLPKFARMRWLSQTIGYSAIKYRIHRMLSFASRPQFIPWSNNGAQHESPGLTREASFDSSNRRSQRG